MQQIRFGVLSTARIGTKKVIPALQAGALCQVAAIASRDLQSARDAAGELGIERACGSYEELLADSTVQAVYNPLPNHLHVPWSIKALEAGKHVLCEKPIGLSAAEGEQLVAAGKAHPHLKLMEAFMFRHHPQWHGIRASLAAGDIGELRSIEAHFSYFNDDPRDIRNQSAIGGALMDIGCYAVSLARWLYGRQPLRVLAMMDIDPRFGTDRQTTAILDFAGPWTSFTCSTQLVRYQRAQLFGTQGRIEVEYPFNAPADRPIHWWRQQDAMTEAHVVEPCDQYTIQGDLFARAILEDLPVPTPIEDAVQNMRVIEAIAASAGQGGWAECA